MKVFLCGQGDAAKTILFEKLLRYYTNRHELMVFTHPDTEWIPDLASNKIPFTIVSVNETVNWAFIPDVIVSVYYRTIIKQHVINAVNGKIFNAHASLLPKHRGRSPVPWAMIEGDTFSGCTYHYIDQGIDTGPIILQAVCQIESSDTQKTLFDKINRLVIDYFSPAFELVRLGYIGNKQIGEPSYHHEGVPYGRQIDPNWSWSKIERFVRAMDYPPYAPAEFEGKAIYTMDDYRQAMFERWQKVQHETERNRLLPVS